MLKHFKGFTLIELMIVIAIIAILAAILIPNFIRARAQTQLAACESNEKNLDNALEMYAAENVGNYPPPNGTFLPDPAGNTNWQSYMKTNPVCPTNKADYLYSVINGATNAFTITQGPTGGIPHQIVGVPTGFPQYVSIKGLIP